MPSTLVGLDIGSSTIKIVEVARAGRDFRIARAAVVPTPRGAVVEGAVAHSEALKDAIADAFRQARIRNRRVNTALGGRAALIREIHLPPMPDEELRRAVRFEAGRYLPAAGENLAVGHHIVAQAAPADKRSAPAGPQAEQRGTAVVFAAARQEVVDGFVDVLKRARVAPQVMEVTSFALMRAFRRAASDGPVLIVDLGAEATDLVVMEADRMQLQRTVPIGGHMLTRAVETALGLDADAAEKVKEEKGIAAPGWKVSDDPVAARVADAIAPVIDAVLAEIRRSLEFLQSRAASRPTGKAILVGGTARLPNLPTLFSEALGLPVEVGDVLQAMRAASAPPGTGPLVAAAVGLALRGAEP